MSILKYLLSVDSATGEAIKLELLGEAGDLSEVDLSQLGTYFHPPGAPSVVVNIFAGPGHVKSLPIGPPWIICPPGTPPTPRHPEPPPGPPPTPRHPEPPPGPPPPLKKS
jgi:hypothetical protein